VSIRHGHCIKAAHHIVLLSMNRCGTAHETAW